MVQLIDFIQNSPHGATLGLLALALGLQTGLAFYLFSSLRSAARERNQLHKEMFGLVKKIEALTAQRREHSLKHYDKILDTLSARLPTTIAAQAGQEIFDIESKILRKLADLDPKLKEDETARQDMEELIKAMEALEDTMVRLTAETVQRIMLDARRGLAEDDRFSDVSNLAA